MRNAASLLTCAAIVAVFAVLAFYRPAPSFTLLAFDARGEAWALDTGLTYEDCARGASALPDIYEAAYCEAEA